MITVYDIDVPEQMKLLHTVLLIFELVLICPGFVIVFTCGYVMFIRVPQFHVHVHIIMASIFLAYLVITATRVAILVIFFFETSVSFEVTTRQPVTVILDCIRSAAASSVLPSIPVLTLERVVATLRMKTYEKERHFAAIFSLQFVCYCWCCLNAYLILYVGVPLVVFLCFGVCWLFINYIVFQRLVQWCQRKYETQMSVQPLTVRFQLSENVRLGKILLATLRSFCFGVTVALFTVFLVTMISIPYKFNIGTLLLYHTFEIELASATALIGLTMINADKKWSREFRQVLADLWICRKKVVFPQKITTSVFSLAGSQLVVRQDAEAGTYFDNLRSQWK